MRIPLIRKLEKSKTTGPGMTDPRKDLAGSRRTGKLMLGPTVKVGKMQSCVRN